jgi:hypothetical protein
MGPYNAIVGVLVFMVVLGAIGTVDVIRGRRRARGGQALPR